jgi:hypothetical protein
MQRRKLGNSGLETSALGLGRLALEDACAVAAAWPADAIRLDAFDAEAGAGAFYARYGFRECGRVVYGGDPLVYYKTLLRWPRAK